MTDDRKIPPDTNTKPVDNPALVRIIKELVVVNRLFIQHIEDAPGLARGWDSVKILKQIKARLDEIETMLNK